jgi:hypothetical protein
VDDTLRDRFVEGADGVEDGRALLGALRPARRLHEATDLGADGAVAQPAVFVLADALDRRLRVRQQESPFVWLARSARATAERNHAAKDAQ